MSGSAARHAWLIGASTGMGLEVGRLLVMAGWQVTLSARSTDILDRAARDIGATAVPLDVTDSAAVRTAAQHLFATQPAELVMINAGDYAPMPLEDFDSALFERLNRVNYLGPVYVLGAVLPLLRDRGGGQVLINASAAGYRGLPRSAPYAAPKAAAIHLAEALHPEAARWGVRLRVINPGFVRSRLTDQNRFHMPGLIEASAAAQRIVEAIDRNGFEIAFPRRLVWLLKLLRCLPYRLYFLIIERRVLGT
ncbi:MAG: SDR family NAD(P)-dependent oxidoreductase [Gammaproteobacteria bacterium]|nr:SDR family NAD(P)-dependent oxidoreductase [Gammaproteobacteria bacterium]